jgi:hypothetical protein
MDRRGLKTPLTTVFASSTTNRDTDTQAQVGPRAGPEIGQELRTVRQLAWRCGLALQVGICAAKDNGARYRSI